MTALHWAAMKNDPTSRRRSLYASANVKATTRIGGYTPLILAAQQGYAAVMEPLIKAGADVNAKTANGTTPLMFAAASGNSDAVRVLLDRGATDRRRRVDARPERARCSRRHPVARPSSNCSPLAAPI